jgi:CheY-like chemotaxis protein
MVTDTPVASATQSESSMSIGPLSVIVADDVEEIQILRETWLSEAGCTVRCASTGHDVLRLLREQEADLVVADVLMPDGDGIDVIMEVKRLSVKTRVLAISGGGRRMQAEDCLKIARGMGAQGVLLKPFNREQFFSAVRRVIQGGS